MLRIQTMIGLSLGLALSAPAYAITCDEIANLQTLNIPETVIVQTVQGSGTKFSASDVKCLESKGLPKSVIDAVRKMAASSENAEDDSPPPGRTVKPADDKSRRFDETESLGGDDGPSDKPGKTLEPSDDEGGGGPKQVSELIKLYKAGKFLTCSKGFYDLLEAKTFPDEETKINYYMAKCLYDLNMYDASQYYYLQVVRKGPKSQYFKYALPRLVQIAQKTGNDTDLLRIVDKIPPEAYPKQARNYMFYLMGRKLYEDGKLKEASKYFDQISQKQNLYLRAQYFQGVIANETGKLRTAVKSFREVVTADTSGFDDAKELEDLKELSLMNIARIYYGLEKFDDADKYYKMVGRDSIYWPESLFERAWANFMTNRWNDTLGLLLTLRSPYYGEQEHQPEEVILRSLTFYSFCEYQSANDQLLGFEERYKAIKTEMDDFVASYQGDEKSKLTDQAFDHYFVEKHKGSKIPKAIFLKILRNRDLADIVKHLDLLDAEEKLIDAQKGAWKDSVGVHLKTVLTEDRARYKRKGGKILVEAFERESQSVGSLLTQAQIIRFEIVDAQRKNYERAAEDPSVLDEGDKVVDFAVDSKWVYWPFNGEFWQDELGYYRYTEQSVCSKK
jgi:hypothetical protein